MKLDHFLMQHCAVSSRSSGYTVRDKRRMKVFCGRFPLVYCMSWVSLQEKGQLFLCTLSGLVRYSVSYLV